MKISFVIPAYNEEERLGTCIKAVQDEVARASADAEIIVVNNASTDRTRGVALSFSGVRVVDEPQKGLARARETGFRASSGQLIANIDADTLMPPGWITKVLDIFSAHDDLVALSGPFIYYDLHPVKRALWHVMYVFGFLGYLINKFVLHMGSMIQGGNNVLKREALEKIGGYDTSLTFYGEDVDIARRLYPLGNVMWTFRLPTYASGRRVAYEGFVRMAFKYTIDYLWTIFSGHPYHTQSIDVRYAMARTTEPASLAGKLRSYGRHGVERIRALLR